MNKLFNTIFWVLILLGACLGLMKIILSNLQGSKEVEGRTGELRIKVRYTPAVAGEDRIFGYRVPYSIVWRVGSGEATEISFSQTAYVAGKRVKAGTYSLWIQPEKERWTLILNAETGQYGTRYDAGKDVYKITVPVENFQAKVDPMRIVLTSGNILDIAWENVGVKVGITEEK